MKRIAYLTSRRYGATLIPPGEVPRLERRSHELIAAAGARRGLVFEVAYWDEPDLAKRGFDAALIRTCWDYHERAEEFIVAIEDCERAELPVFNRPSAVRWNARKTYLKDLGEAAIETVWAERADAGAVDQAFAALNAVEIVVKPQVGAGSAETVRLRRSAWSEADLARAPRGAAMIQPFLSAIETEGERSLFWFGGAYSHAIRKIPKGGDWRANIPGETRFIAEPAPPAALQAAEAALARAPTDLVYVRVDLVLGDDGRWRVIEIEAIEPYLFLDLAPDGADLFAAAIARVLGV